MWCYSYMPVEIFWRIGLINYICPNDYVINQYFQITLNLRVLLST